MKKVYIHVMRFDVEEVSFDILAVYEDEAQARAAFIKDMEGRNLKESIKEGKDEVLLTCDDEVCGYRLEVQDVVAKES